ncbi:MAG: hypothetical protein Q9M28_00715 [Mariprofundaceae bacterium]|nr:hypothetical protein [Mariprofundaceae bacterium]
MNQHTTRHMIDLRNKLEEAGDGLHAVGEILSITEPSLYLKRENYDEWVKRMGFAVAAIGQHVAHTADDLNSFILDVENMLKQREMDDDNENNHEPVQVNDATRKGEDRTTARGSSNA